MLGAPRPVAKTPWPREFDGPLLGREVDKQDFAHHCQVAETDGLRGLTESPTVSFTVRRSVEDTGAG